MSRIANILRRIALAIDGPQPREYTPTRATFEFQVQLDRREIAKAVIEEMRGGEARRWTKCRTS